MIRRRAIGPVLLGFLLLVMLFGAGTVRPEVGIAADALVLARAEAADQRLADLQDELVAALDAGRDGASAIVAGSEPPGPRLRDAAELTLAAGAAADDVETALATLAGARAARGPSAAPIPDGTSAAELASIAEQLEGTVGAADEFATMRRWAAAVPEALEAALAAVANGDLSEAEAQAVVARHAHDEVVGWDVDFVTLPIWIDASDATIDAVEDILEAVRAGRAAEARRLAEEFATLADDAVRADRALQITISEDGGLVAAAPLSRLAAAKRAVDEQRAAVGDLIATERRRGASSILVAASRTVYSVAASPEPT
jgi:hypothetical protein